MNPRIYKFCEVFYSLQGEGQNTGRPSLFLRLSGCNLSCAFCDEPLHKDKNKIIFEGSAEGFVGAWAWEFETFRKTAGSKGLIVLSGGEPTLYDLDFLISAITKRFGKLEFAVETNGLNLDAVKLANLISFSPKVSADKFAPKSLEALKNSNFTRLEVKLVMDTTEESCAYVKSWLQFFEDESFGRERLPVVYISPINDALSINKKNVEHCINFVKSNARGLDIRLNTQLHKFWGVR